MQVIFLQANSDKGNLTKPLSISIRFFSGELI
ncbi:hypothetical protein CLV53_101347 [Sediminibacterium magnilacihabitans]|jgi:hypothetical protein|nr:hypothetical protein CLV53_101347 [Sediminibacterium magnilacihabitans]